MPVIIIILNIRSTQHLLIWTLNLNLRLHIELPFHASGYSCQFTQVFLCFSCIYSFNSSNLPRSSTSNITVINLMSFFNVVFCLCSFTFCFGMTKWTQWQSLLKMLLVKMCIYWIKKKNPKPVISNLIMIGTLFWSTQSVMDSMKLQESGLFSTPSV